MFTGIVEEVGRVRSVASRGNGVVLDIAAARVVADLAPGASIAVQGVCLTTLEHDANGFKVAAEAETLRVTTLGALRAGARVNLERALAASGRFDGHIVLGHVDGRGWVLRSRSEGQTRILEIVVPAELRPFVVPKGCIAVNGVSLTVGPSAGAWERLTDDLDAGNVIFRAGVPEGCFELFIIPYTWEHTALNELRVGSEVNIETDIVGRYVAHLIGRANAPAKLDLDWSMLVRAFGKVGNG